MIVLDTHTLVWWANGEGEALSAGAREAIEAELDGGRILVSSISAWVLAMLVACGRMALSMDVSEWPAAVPVVTADAKIRDYPHVRSIW